jgi:hypothetical protein
VSLVHVRLCEWFRAPLDSLVSIHFGVIFSFQELVRIWLIFTAIVGMFSFTVCLMSDTRGRRQQAIIPTQSESGSRVQAFAHVSKHKSHEHQTHIHMIHLITSLSIILISVPISLPLLLVLFSYASRFPSCLTHPTVRPSTVRLRSLHLSTSHRHQPLHSNLRRQRTARRHNKHPSKHSSKHSLRHNNKLRRSRPSLHSNQHMRR